MSLLHIVGGSRLERRKTMDQSDPPKGLAVPSGRLPRLAMFGSVAGRIAGDVLWQGARQFDSGKRPSLGDLLLTASNALKLTNQLAQLRDSIDSDVTNVAALIRMSGLLSKTLDLDPLLDEAGRQQREEADCVREGACPGQFFTLLADAPDYLVPALHPDLTTRNVQAMDFVNSVPIETLTEAPQAERDRIVSLLLRLMFRELFEFGLMQTDPNFANQRHDRASGRIVLLDFGATRVFDPAVGAGYRALLTAGLAADACAVQALTLQFGFYPETVAAKHRQAILAMIEMIFEPLRAPGPFDFATTHLAVRLRAAGMAMNADRDFWHIPPVDMLFLRRKLGGMYLLAGRLKAQVDIKAILQEIQAVPNAKTPA